MYGGRLGPLVKFSCFVEVAHFGRDVDPVLCVVGKVFEERFTSAPLNLDEARHGGVGKRRQCWFNDLLNEKRRPPVMVMKWLTPRVSCVCIIASHPCRRGPSQLLVGSNGSFITRPKGRSSRMHCRAFGGSVAQTHATLGVRQEQHHGQDEERQRFFVHASGLQGRFEHVFSGLLNTNVGQFRKNTDHAPPSRPTPD